MSWLKIPLFCLKMVPNSPSWGYGHLSPKVSSVIWSWWHICIAFGLIRNFDHIMEDKSFHLEVLGSKRSRSPPPNPHHPPGVSLSWPSFKRSACLYIYDKILSFLENCSPINYFLLHCILSLFFKVLNFRFYSSVSALILKCNS